MAIRIGTISISLEASTASFQGGMERASAIAMTSARNIEKAFTTMAATITGAMGAAVGSLGYLIDKTEDTIFQMQKMAAQAGVSMESFSKLAYAAKTAGMPVDQMAVILTRISKSSFEAASGNKMAAAAYSELGVKIADANGHFKTADQLAIEVAQSLNHFRESAGKTGLETTIMGRSGAQAAEFMKTLATRFDEVSATATKLGVVFGEDTADAARKLHDQFLLIEEAGLGLSTRLLTQVSPALDELTNKIADLVSNPESLKKIEAFGDDLAKGIHVAGEALEFLVEHFDTVKRTIEALALIRLGGMFGPMISSAVGATNFFGKLGIASGNVVGKLLGIKNLGTIFAPITKSAAGYTRTVVTLAKEEGVASTATLVLGDAAGAMEAAFASALLPITAVTVGIGALGLEIKTIHDLNSELKKDGLDWTDVWATSINHLIGSFENFKNTVNEFQRGGVAGVISGIGIDAGMNSHPLAQRLTNTKLAAPPGLPKDYYTNPAYGAGDQQKLKDAKGLDTTAGKVDELTKRLKELHDKATAAQEALKFVGVSSDIERQVEIARKYALFLDEATSAKRKLTAAEKAAAYTDISNTVNAEAAEKYQKALYDQSEAIQTSVQEHTAMAAAVGKSAQAMQNAAIDAKVDQAMQKSYGAGWKDNLDAVMDAELMAMQVREEMNAANAESDAKSNDELKNQVTAQQRLNDAVLQGADAKRAAALANEQDRIRQDFGDRSDTNNDALNARLAAAQKLSELDKENADKQRASALDVTERYKEQIQAINDAAAAAERAGRALDFHQVLAADKEAWIQYQDAQDKAILATGSMMDGLKVALSQMSRDTQTAAEMMSSALQDAVHTMNDTLAQIMTEHHKRGTHEVRNQFSGAFRGIGDDIAKKGLNKVEGSIFGLGKADGSSGNPFSVKVVNWGTGSGSAAGGNELSDLLSHTSSTSANSAGNAVGSVMGSAAKLLLPMFADGTDSMIPGMPSIVGEKGPEVFIPPSAGAVVPNSKLKNGFGDTHNWQIDARGSNDPAQTVALIDAYMKQAAPKISANTIKSMNERRARTPSTRH